VALSDVVPNPRQPRTEFDDDSLRELAESLRRVGLLQPILVRSRDDGRYEIIAGERRVRAARMADLDQVPAIVRRMADEDVLTAALIENLHRADLNPLEEAAAYRQLLDDFGMTHEELALKLGRSRSSISNALRLLCLPASLQERLLTGSLSAGHARALLGLAEQAQQERIATRVVVDGLSVRATEELVRTLTEDTVNGRAAPAVLTAPTSRHPVSLFAEAERRLAHALATTVRIKGTPRRGRVVIEYAGPADLERLLALLDRGVPAGDLDGNG
jgi:ParB family chromosome partitioning protein